jgi:hypothetical protein
MTQAAVMEMLGVDEGARAMDPLQLAASLIRAFASYVDGAYLRELGGDPVHDPELYLKVWAQVQELGEQQCSDRSGTDTHADCTGEPALKRHMHEDNEVHIPSFACNSVQLLAQVWSHVCGIGSPPLL